MKKLLLVLGIILFGSLCQASDTVLTGGVDFDWVNLPQVQRDAQIADYQSKIFGEEIITKISKICI